MDKKTLDKVFILIYPIQHSNTFPVKVGKEMGKTAWGKEDREKKREKKGEGEREGRKNGGLRERIGEKMNNLAKIKECKSLSPRLRKDWLNDFISTVNKWDSGIKVKQELEKQHCMLRSSVANVLQSVEHLRKKPTCRNKTYKIIPNKYQ
jgi:hypothetical protein